MSPRYTKEKYPCLNHLRLSPTYAASIVKCCATLRNFAREEDEDNIITMNEEADELVHVNGGNEHEVEEADNEVHLRGRLRQLQILPLMM
ncbi:hypothetical protein PR048_031487 [Dryococelus australis]|uniref:Uncharacterized protein n=1 Tax=Dryococelus australis TaxID=614101 RepID=A0ABQ9G5E6_9NEOP|nr:hypothetical protein PR048_031487 [Dryococelus australis]